MTQFKCIVINPAPPPQPEDYDDREKYYQDLERYDEGYWSSIIDNPLIFLPENTIIFWGFEVKLSRNEYDLLKSITDLNSSNYSNTGYTAEKILKNVDYRRNNLEKAKNITLKRTIITLKSSIKKKISNKVVEVSISVIKGNKFNPFAKGTNKDKELKGDIEKICNEMLSDKKLRNEILDSELNLTKIFPCLLDFLKTDDSYYSAFNIKKAVNGLIRSAKGYFKTDFSFNVQHKSKRKYLPQKTKKSKFNYAPLKFKPNLYNFVNDVNSL
jgi:hypothetical protein